MAKERRDSKNRLLEKGEYQKSDGRYMYRYTDVNGIQRFVYSWTLTKSDRTPKGKTQGPCLRELEKEIAKDLVEMIDSHTAQNTTLDHYFELFISQKKGLERSTRRNYRYNYDLYIANTFGKRKISDIKYSDIKSLYNSMIYDKGLTIGTVGNINNFMHQTFALAERDNVIRHNPVNNVLLEIKKECKFQSTKRHALTVDEQNAFIDFVRSNKKYSHWLPIFTFMLGTGCRVGEMAGLTWDDCDFKNDIIKINRTLMYHPDEHTGKAQFFIAPPKTDAGRREIPMFQDVKKMLLDERMYQMRYGFSKSEIDGVSRFVFNNKDGYAYAPKNINAAIGRIISSYNKTEEIMAEKENRSPLLLPHFTAHNLRHTFCTRMCENVTDVKLIQEIMGHATMSVTMDIYNEVTMDRKQEAFSNLECKFKIC